MSEPLAPAFRRLLVSVSLLALAVSACGQGALSTDSTPTSEPTPTASETPSPKPTGPPEPYTEFAAYRVRDSYQPDFELSRPSEWQVVPPNLSEDDTLWTYVFEDAPTDIEPEVAGCSAGVQLAFTVDEDGQARSFPEAEGEMQVGGERATFAIFTRGDPELDEWNENYSQPGCLTLVARAQFTHAKFGYSFVLQSTLEEAALDGEDFKRILREFRFLP